MNKENCEEHPRSNLAQNSNAPRSQEDYITQISEEFEGRITKRLSKEFSGTENRILGAFARLDNFLMNSLLQGHSGATPKSSRNPLSTSQRTNEDDSQIDPHPEAGLFHSQITQNSGPEADHDSDRLSPYVLQVLHFVEKLERQKGKLDEKDSHTAKQTTLPVYDRTSKKFEQHQDLSVWRLSRGKRKTFAFTSTGPAIQNSKDINSPQKENWIFRRSFLKTAIRPHSKT